MQGLRPSRMMLAEVNVRIEHCPGRQQNDSQDWRIPVQCNALLPIFHDFVRVAKQRNHVSTRFTRLARHWRAICISDWKSLTHMGVLVRWFRSCLRAIISCRQFCSMYPRNTSWTRCSQPLLAETWIAPVFAPARKRKKDADRKMTM